MFIYVPPFSPAVCGEMSSRAVGCLNIIENVALENVFTPVFRGSDLTNWWHGYNSLSAVIGPSISCPPTTRDIFKSFSFLRSLLRRAAFIWKVHPRYPWPLRTCKVCRWAAFVSWFQPVKGTAKSCCDFTAGTSLSRVDVSSSSLTISRSPPQFDLWWVSSSSLEDDISSSQRGEVTMRKRTNHPSG